MFEDAPCRGEISLIFTRYVQNNIQATFARRKPNWFPLFPGPAFPKLFHFYFVLFFFFFFFIYIIVYLPFSPQNLFFPSFFNLQRFKKFSYTNYQTKFRRKRNEIEFRRFFDNIILHTRTNTKSFEQPFEDSRYRLTNNWKFIFFSLSFVKYNFLNIKLFIMKSL